MRRLVFNILMRFAINEEDVLMMSMLWANQILLGKKTYAQVPRLLKKQVKEILIDSGYEELVVE